MRDSDSISMDVYLKVEGISKAFGKFTALEDVSFEVRRGEFLCVLGPSGCGKTTILRVIAGLEMQDCGRVYVEGEEISKLPVSMRNVGIVFQSYALFPNLTAWQNIAYGLQGRSLRKGEIKQRVKELLNLVGLTDMAAKYPAQLSGGQQQRVALARAIAISPALLLLDEPLSALDAKVRLMLRSEIKHLQQRFGLTTIMVTHDQEEALTMADRILVMDQGSVVQDGSPDEIYEKPATPFVASFIGSMNFIDNVVKESAGAYRTGGTVLRVKDSESIPRGALVTVAIRPEEVMLKENGDMSWNTLPAQVCGLEYRGSTYRVNFKLPFGESVELIIEAEIPTEKVKRLSISEEMPVNISLPTESLRVYPN